MLTLKMKDIEVHIKNDPIKVGEILDFQAVDALNQFKITKLSELDKTKKIVSSVPSLDTKTCALQTAKFNTFASENFSDYTIVTVSKDLPFAQGRFCQALKINQNFHVWSDYRNDENNFASVTKLVIDENQLLARCVMILDENNKILYQQIVEQVSTEPNYEEIIAFINNLDK